MAKVKILQLICCLLLSCLSTKYVAAQYYDEDDTEQKRVWAGFVLGTNISQVSGDFLQGYRKWGINGGLTSGIKLAPHFATSLEILYSVRGARASQLELPYPGLNGKLYRKYGIQLPYFELPVLFNYYDKNRSSIGLGVSYGRLSNPKEMLDSVNLADTYKFKSNDWNLVINTNLAMYKNKAFFNLRFGYSLANIRQNHNPFLLHRPQQFSKWFALRAIYLL